MHPVPSQDPGLTAPSAPGAAPWSAALPGLRAILLLAGKVGRNPLADGVGRPVVDLPVDARRTIVDLWIDETSALAGPLGGVSQPAPGPAPTEVRVVVDRGAALPEAPRAPTRLAFVHDPADYRGTAGLVRDLTAAYDEDDRVLVVPANQIRCETLRSTLAALAAHEEAVCVVPTSGGDFASAFLLRCGRLREVPEIGFVDLKEQAIPSARGRLPLHVVTRAAGATYPVRTLAHYIHALRALHARRRAGAAIHDPFAETWEPAFSIVEPGAEVAADAVLQDAVVLRGARVESGAVVSQSVVCPGARVRRGTRVLGTVVTG